MITSKYYTISQVTKILKCHISDVDDLIMTGELKYVDRRPVLIDGADLIIYLNSKKKQINQRYFDDLRSANLDLPVIHAPTKLKPKRRTKEEIKKEKDDYNHCKNVCEAMHRLADKKRPVSYIRSVEQQVQDIIDNYDSGINTRRAVRTMSWWKMINDRYGFYGWLD